jgi:hypothetical protein
MSDPIYGIIERLALIEGKTTPVNVKHGLNKQQQGVPQLPALLKPKNISPTLTKKPYQAHPLDGYMVGENSLAEAMQEVEEDMISRVKGQFADYLEKLEKENHLDGRLVRKAKAELNIDDDPQTEDEVEEATWDSDVAPVSDPGDTEVAHGLENDIATAVSQPTAPLGESPARIYTLEDGACLECWGDDDRGYEVRHAGRSLPTRFPNIDHADMAVKLFQKRRQAAQQDQNQDYIEEK